YRGGPDRHVVRGSDSPGRTRRRDPADRRSRGAAVHRGTPCMKRENEFAVGVVVIAAFAVVVAGALWLSGAHLGRTEAVYTARFRTVGGLGAGDPVVLRGVRVGRVEAIRLAPGNWVEADLKIYAGVTPPATPAVIAASASLFGEWAATLISRDPPPADPNVRQALAEAQAAGGGKWPGATLPDIGQLTAQASRIATDIATVANPRSASQDFHDLLESAHKNQESLVRTLVAADSVMSRIANRSGTLGLLVSDSTLYKETTLTMIQLRQLLSDIQANPRKYFTFSVFYANAAV